MVSLFLFNNEKLTNRNFYISLLIIIIFGTSLIVINFVKIIKRNKNKKPTFYILQNELDLYYTNSSKLELKDIKDFQIIFTILGRLLFPITLLIVISESIVNLIAL